MHNVLRCSPSSTHLVTVIGQRIAQFLATSCVPRYWSKPFMAPLSIFFRDAQWNEQRSSVEVPVRGDGSLRVRLALYRREPQTTTRTGREATRTVSHAHVTDCCLERTSRDLGLAQGEKTAILVWAKPASGRVRLRRAEAEEPCDRLQSFLRRGDHVCLHRAAGWCQFLRCSILRHLQHLRREASSLVSPWKMWALQMSHSFMPLVFLRLPALPLLARFIGCSSTCLPPADCILLRKPRMSRTFKCLTTALQLARSRIGQLASSTSFL